ncbi:MAG: flagellar basal body rod C-terminal domain-containing protein [Bilophila sp.]
MGIAINLGAMQAFADGVSVTAHNVANTNTRDFQRWSHTYTSDAKGSVQNVVEAGDPLRGVAGALAEERGSLWHAGVPDTNNVDTGREMTSLVSDQRAFEANAAVITTRSDMDDTLLGIMVDQKA